MLPNRNKLPRWFNALVDAIADHPDSILGKLAARRLGLPSGQKTGVTDFDDRPTRVLIAPVNYSGQAREWARALETHSTSVSARSMAVEVPGGFEYSADLVVPVAVFHNDPDWQRRQYASIGTAATHLLVEAEEPPFGRLLGRSVENQVLPLMTKGIDVALMCHGTDIRLPSRHMRRTSWSMYNDPSVYTPRLEAVAQRNRDLIDRLDRPVFVSTPDLLADVPQAHWCPVVVDPRRWERPQDSVGEQLTLRVLHAPSASTLKGTPLIMPVLDRLSAEGVLRYELVTGMRSSEMPSAYHRADVVLDQFRTGSYGVAACEAMAAGCVVLGHVLNDVRGVVRDVSGMSLPIVEADPDTLEQSLRLLAADASLRNHLADEGMRFVTEVHDGTMSARVLDQYWLQTDNAFSPNENQ